MLFSRLLQYKLLAFIVLAAFLIFILLPHRPRSTEATARECSTIAGLDSDLQSGASIWSSEHLGKPRKFGDFVTTAELSHKKGGPYMTLKHFGPNASAHPCQIEDKLITCEGTFNYYAPQWTFNKGEILLVTPVKARPDVALCK